jgi:hypothetical protein
MLDPPGNGSRSADSVLIAGGLRQGGSARISTGSVASVPLTSRMTLPGMLWPPLKRHPEATSG